MCFASGGSETQRALCFFQGCVSVRELFFKTPNSQMLCIQVTQTHTQTHIHINTSVFFAARQTDVILCSTYPKVQFSTPRPLSLLRQSRPSPHLQTHACAHTKMRVHGTQWLLFIVHSFMWRASCLAWYSIILQPTLSFPAIPRGTRQPQAHSSDCATH